MSVLAITRGARSSAPDRCFPQPSERAGTMSQAAMRASIPDASDYRLRIRASAQAPAVQTIAADEQESSRARFALRECASASDGRAGVRSVGRLGPQLLRRPSGRVRRRDRECRNGRGSGASAETRQTPACSAHSDSLVVCGRQCPRSPGAAVCQHACAHSLFAGSGSVGPASGASSRSARGHSRSK
jgi:hypothetical protein